MLVGAFLADVPGVTWTLRWTPSCTPYVLLRAGYPTVGLSTLCERVGGLPSQRRVLRLRGRRRQVRRRRDALRVRQQSRRALQTQQTLDAEGVEAADLVDGRDSWRGVGLLVTHHVDLDVARRAGVAAAAGRVHVTGVALRTQQTLALACGQDRSSHEKKHNTPQSNTKDKGKNIKTEENYCDSIRSRLSRRWYHKIWAMRLRKTNRLLFSSICMNSVPSTYYSCVDQRHINRVILRDALNLIGSSKTY